MTFLTSVSSVWGKIQGIYLQLGPSLQDAQTRNSELEMGLVI